MSSISRQTRWWLSLLLLGVVSGCGGPVESGSAVKGDSESSGFVQDLSGRFSVSISSEHEATLHYSAPDGLKLYNVEIRAVPTWHLQSVLDGMQPPTKGIDVRWDSLGPDESRTIDFGEPSQLHDAVTSVQIEGTAELRGSPIRFSMEQRR